MACKRSGVRVSLSPQTVRLTNSLQTKGNKVVITDEDRELFQEIISDLSAEDIVNRHKDVYCDVNTKEMNTFLNEEGRILFIKEIEKAMVRLKFFAEKDFFELCDLELYTLHIRLEKICVDFTRENCCSELNSARQWISSCRMCCSLMVC